VDPADLRLATVPGALELPLALQTFGRTGRFDALIALGAVIRGEPTTSTLVSNEMGAGITASRSIWGCRSPTAYLPPTPTNRRSPA